MGRLVVIAAEQAKSDEQQLAEIRVRIDRLRDERDRAARELAKYEVTLGRYQDQARRLEDEVDRGDVLVLGFYAASTHQYQQRLVEEAGPAEKIVLTTPHASDIEQWFGPSRIEEIRRMPGVDCAFPCVELSGRVSLDDREPTPVTLESTAPGDPTTSPLRMSWGGSVEAGPGDQAVLGQTLFERLGGVLTADGPVPDRLIVCIERSRSRVLDCLNPHGSPTAGLVVPFCDAYVPEEEVGRVVGDCRSLGVTAERVGAVEIYVPDQPVMFRIDRWDGASLTRHDKS